MRELLAGMAVATAAGLLMGAAMRPDLYEGELLAPQLFSVAPADHSIPDAAPPAAYVGPVPDYVYGTDWKRRTEEAVEPLPVELADVVVNDAPPPPAGELTFEGLPVAPIAYPSLNDAPPPVG